jgi:hypothetical protein
MNLGSAIITPIAIEHGPPSPLTSPKHSGTTTAAHNNVHTHVKRTRFPQKHPSADTVDSDGSSVHTTPSLHGSTHSALHAPKTDVDAHFRLDAVVAPAATRQEEASSASAESPPPFSSHNFPSRYFPAPSPEDPYRALVTECGQTASLTALAPPSGPAPPFEESRSAESSVVAETKAALPRDTKDGQSSKDLDDGEPPPPYTEGSSPLEGFTYVMAAAGGAASIITQVQQGGPAPLNTALGGKPSGFASWWALADIYSGIG